MSWRAFDNRQLNIWVMRGFLDSDWERAVVHDYVFDPDYKPEITEPTVGVLFYSEMPPEGYVARSKFYPASSRAVLMPDHDSIGRRVFHVKRLP